jgi:hypothetical protein
LTNPCASLFIHRSAWRNCLENRDKPRNGGSDGTQEEGK